MAEQVESIKWVPNTRFLVDGFRFQSPRCSSYFLSHMHGDHYCGARNFRSQLTGLCACFCCDRCAFSRFSEQQRATAVASAGRRTMHSPPPATPSAAQAHQTSVCLHELTSSQPSCHHLRHPTAGGSCSSTCRPDKELWSGPPGGADLLQHGHGGAAGARLWAAAAPRARAAHGPGGHH